MRGGYRNFVILMFAAMAVTVSMGASFSSRGHRKHAHIAPMAIVMPPMMIISHPHQARWRCLFFEGPPLVLFVCWMRMFDSSNGKARKALCVASFCLFRASQLNPHSEDSGVQAAQSPYRDGTLCASNVVVGHQYPIGPPPTAHSFS